MVFLVLAMARKEKWNQLFRCLKLSLCGGSCSYCGWRVFKRLRVLLVLFLTFLMLSFTYIWIRGGCIYLIKDAIWRCFKQTCQNVLWMKRGVSERSSGGLSEGTWPYFITVQILCWLNPATAAAQLDDASTRVSPISNLSLLSGIIFLQLLNPTFPAGTSTHQ